MTEFIEAFKNTTYYKKLFNSTEVLAIVILGSHSTELFDSGSDYDINVLTLGGQFINASEYEYLIYKNKKVHWYFVPLADLFVHNYSHSLRYVALMQMQNLHDGLVIYKNHKYKKILDMIFASKDTFSLIGMHRLYEARKSFIDDILVNDRISNKHCTKGIYHLCLASYYITQEKPDKEFLITLKLKLIDETSVSEEYKRLIIDRLKIYKTFVEANENGYNDALLTLSEELAICEQLCKTI